MGQLHFKCMKLVSRTFQLYTEFNCLWSLPQSNASDSPGPPEMKSISSMHLRSIQFCHKNFQTFNWNLIGFSLESDYLHQQETIQNGCFMLFHVYDPVVYPTDPSAFWEYPQWSFVVIPSQTPGLAVAVEFKQNPKKSFLTSEDTANQKEKLWNIIST